MVDTASDIGLGACEMVRHMICGMVALSSAAIAAPQSPDMLPDRFVAAWNSHDPKAFESLYTADAIWVPVAEERTEGRAAITAAFASIHTGKGWATATTIARRDRPEVHVLTPNVATIFFHMDFLKDGKPIAGLERAMILVAVRSRGGWRVAAGQFTKETLAADG
ncbi:SgcJ/EcaC family oxidoreductase [Sphingomonas aurantiaca]|uniref:SgcJ/EcaC family oxidoreductase n=1 Tax=Sphingomonas TaxID=13687 RepID=UPI0009E7D4AC|nr:SgcJ/EcaC family oxidoreductase [Sphingomonas sp. Leaf28]